VRACDVYVQHSLIDSLESLVAAAAAAARVGRMTNESRQHIHTQHPAGQRYTWSDRQTDTCALVRLPSSVTPFSDLPDVRVQCNGRNLTYLVFASCVSK